MLTERAPAAPPHGLPAIIATFGDPRPFIGRDASISPAWEVQHITRVKLPRPMRYAHGEVCRVPVHKVLARHVHEMFADLDDMGLWDEIEAFGAGYEVRPMTTCGGLSTHAWGIAVDLVPVFEMPPRVVTAFAHYGFSWGGPLAPEHFQFATGYGLLPGCTAVDRVTWRPEPLPHETAFVAT